MITQYSLYGYRQGNRRAVFPPWLSRGACLGIILILLGMAGCTSSPNADRSRDDPSARPQGSPSTEHPDGGIPFAAPRPGVANREELTVVFYSDQVELDFRKSYLASEAQVYTAIYEGLFTYHPFTMEPVRALAEDWQISDDKKTWTFTLRRTGRYWNGDPVRAADFRAAWLSLLDPARQSPYSSLFDIIIGAKEYRLGTVTDPSTLGIETPNDYTLIVRLNSPASFFPAMLCHHSFGPIHPSMTNKTNWAAEGPVISNGPFYIVRNEEGLMRLEKNPYYWDSARVALNSLTFRLTQDRELSTALWNSGEARWISGDVDLEALTDRSGIMVNAIFATHYYFIRSAKKPWDDYRVRRALTLALPWEQIREGFYLPATTLIYPIPGYPRIAGLDTTDTEEARRLLAEAGYPNGNGIPEMVIRLTPSLEAARIGGLMAASWMQELGITVRIEIIPYSQYFQSLKANDYEVGFSTWIGDFADPYTFLQMWRRDSNLNDARLNDTDYEDLMDKSMIEEGETRWRTMSEAEKLLLDRGSVLPISFSSAINIVDTGELEGWYPNALDIHPFKYLSFKAFRPLPGVAVLPPEQLPGR